ncbi:MAG: hemerythrin domain-containing protein [Parcubacteria group bacterium]
MTHYPSEAQRGGGANFGLMAGALAIGMFAGLAASQSRKVISQAPALAAGNWVDALKAEHRLVEKAFESLLGTDETQTMKRKMLLSKIAHALTKHANEEENVIYPALAQSTMAERADEMFHEHAQMKTALYELKQMDIAQPQWIERARELFELIQRHVQEEETEVLPQLQASLSDEENKRLNLMMNWEGYKVA